MSKPTRVLPLLAFALLIAGCDGQQPMSPGLDDLPAPQLTVFPPGQVAMIGGSTLSPGLLCWNSTVTHANVMRWTGGGCLPVSGTPVLDAFTFVPFDAGSVGAGTLAPFDIAVVNMATYAIRCNPNNIPQAAKDEIIAFAGAGKKVLIYDSECYLGPGTGLDYSWLPYPFTTANPGAMGAQGTLTIVEENTLSTNAPGPYFINALVLGTQTDAVGDMNVLATQDPAWCVDMAGTNAINVTGAVHVYANYPLGTDMGLFIYNGLDMDYLTINTAGSAELRKVWENELLQPVDPSGLPCRIPVVNIKLDPPSAENHVGESHTVTATVTDLLSNPQVGTTVDFSVLDGPNAGTAGSAATDALGQATFTYSGVGGVGTDHIQACFTDPQGVRKCSNTVEKIWVNVAPTCEPVEVSSELVLLGDEVFASASFNDPLDPGDHTATWDWGDGTSSAGTVDQTAHTVGPDGHTYGAVGSYIINIEVTDAYGASCGARSIRVRVFDPGAGFITGGGWIDSPPGAYRPDPSIGGRANFGFEARYPKGELVPKGTMEFQLHDADLNFHAKTMYWLLVMDDDTALLRGEGTINGDLSPGGVPYTFMMWFNDAKPDTFRFWIWGVDEGGVLQLIYQNGPALPVSGGNLVIHRGK